MNYAKKLQDPLWQKKRLEILHRDNFTCKLCKDTETTLHVHHITYADEPWNADDADLVPLCKHCHATWEWFKVKFKGQYDCFMDEDMVIRKQPVSDNLHSVFVLQPSTENVYLFYYHNSTEDLEFAFVSPFYFFHSLSGQLSITTHGK